MFFCRASWVSVLGMGVHVFASAADLFFLSTALLGRRYFKVVVPTLSADVPPSLKQGGVVAWTVVSPLEFDGDPHDLCLYLHCYVCLWVGGPQPVCRGMDWSVCVAAFSGICNVHRRWYVRLTLTYGKPC